MTNVTILHLPVEILTRIAYDTRDLPQEKYNQDQTRLEKLKNLRLSCKTFANVGAQSLFEQVSLYPDQESHDRRKFNIQPSSTQKPYRYLSICATEAHKALLQGPHSHRLYLNRP